MYVNNTLTNWSYKKIKMYRGCPMSVRLKYIDRIPEPEPDPKYDAKRLRGIKLHDQLAESVNLGVPVPQEFAHVQPVVDGYREIGAVAENQEFFDNQWKSIPSYDGHWLQVIKDVRVRTPEFALVGDWKTGKKHGNEYDHFEQMKLYAVTEFVIDPGKPEYMVELHYVDQDETWDHTFCSRDLERFLGDFERDVDKMMTDTIFRPKPSMFNCQYCVFGPRRGNGACPVGV